MTKNTKNPWNEPEAEEAAEPEAAAEPEVWNADIKEKYKTAINEAKRNGNEHEADKLKKQRDHDVHQTAIQKLGLDIDEEDYWPTSARSAIKHTKIAVYNLDKIDLEEIVAAYKDSPADYRKPAAEYIDVIECKFGESDEIDTIINFAEGARRREKEKAEKAAADREAKKAKLKKVREEAEAENEIRTALKDMPLHLAAFIGDTNAIFALVSSSVPAAARALLDAKAEIEAKDNDGKTPLHWAAAEGHEEATRALLNAGAKIEAKGNDGKTPLHWAAVAGHKKTTRALLNAGADRKAKDNDGKTPDVLTWSSMIKKIGKALLSLFLIIWLLGVILSLIFSVLGIEPP